MAFFNKLNPFGAPGLRTLGKSAPIKKLGMSPKPAATPGLGPSTDAATTAATGAAQQMGLGGNKPGIMAGQGGQYGKHTLGDPGMQTKLRGPMFKPMNNRGGGMEGIWENPPMRGPMNGPAINRGGGLPFQGDGGPRMNDMRQRNPWEMGGMQRQMRDMMMGGMGPQQPQGQLQGTPNPEGVMPESLPTGQPMPQEPGAGPSPDMMQQLMQRMGGNRGFGGGMRGPMFGGMRGRGFNAGGGSPVDYLS